MRRKGPDMPQLLEQHREAPTRERDKAVKILAKSLFRQLKTDGYDTRQVVALATELISLVTTDMKPGATPSTVAAINRILP